MRTSVERDDDGPEPVDAPVEGNLGCGDAIKEASQAPARVGRFGCLELKLLYEVASETAFIGVEQFEHRGGVTQDGFLEHLGVEF